MTVLGWNTAVDKLLISTHHTAKTVCAIKRFGTPNRTKTAARMPKFLPLFFFCIDKAPQKRYNTNVGISQP